MDTYLYTALNAERSQIQLLYVKASGACSVDMHGIDCTWPHSKLQRF